MKILIVASYNKGRYAPFIVEQAEALKKHGCDIEFYGLQGKGLWGYAKNLPGLKRIIKEWQPDIVHAHYGLSGLLANFQRMVPVVTTFHGSDINEKKVLPFSKMAMCLSAWNIFVSQRMLAIARPKKNYTLLPCGIDINELQLTDKTKARQKMGLFTDIKYVLFAGAYDNFVKNALLAKKVVEILSDDQVELIELKGYSREEVTLLMCAVDAFLMTSLAEGSPQVIKEAMACGCPIVSVDVGDVKERIDGVNGCFVSSSREPKELAELLRKAIAFEGRTRGRSRIIELGLENKQVAKSLMELYQRVLERD